MPSVLMHLAAVEQLAQGVAPLPAEFARALSEDIEYARLGALFADLPRYEGFQGGLEVWRPRAEVPYFSQLLHERAPVEIGLQLCELVAAGALVGREPGLALVAGYFAHLALDQRLHPLVEELSRRSRGPKESVAEAHQRIEWLQGVFYLRDLHGDDALAGKALRERFQITKSGGFPTRGVGRGIYEMLRLSCEELLHEAPTKAQVDGWARGLYLFAWMLSTPLAHARLVLPYRALSRLELYSGSDVQVPQLVGDALRRTADALGQLSVYMQRGSFTQRSRARLLANFALGPNSGAAERPATGSGRVH